jgi:TM2 domain-containing membrane protein YozV
MSTAPTSSKHCFACGAPIDLRAEICPKCGVRQPGASSAGSVDPAVRQAAGTKVAAGLCAILLGYLGVHKFILGMTTPGIIMLLVTLLTCGIGAAVTSIIGLVEGIIYLTKSDQDFYETYVVGKKEWF